MKLLFHGQGQIGSGGEYGSLPVQQWDQWSKLRLLCCPKLLEGLLQAFAVAALSLTLQPESGRSRWEWQLKFEYVAHESHLEGLE